MNGSENERLAVVETKVDGIISDTTVIKTQLDTLIKHDHIIVTLTGAGLKLVSVTGVVIAGLSLVLKTLHII